MDAYFKSEGFDTIGFEESVWVRPAGDIHSDDIYVSAHVDDCLLSCKLPDVMSKFKRDLLSRFGRGRSDGISRLRAGSRQKDPHWASGAGWVR